jgi:pyrimidine deaminase RibD-like protein
MGVMRVEEDGLQLGAGLIFGLSKPNPNKICVVVNDKQAIAQAVWRGDADGTPHVTRKMLKRACRFVRCIAISWG